MSRILLFFFILSSLPCVFSQGKEENIEEIIIEQTKNSDKQGITLDTKRIADKLPTDVGQLMTLFPGVQLKSYGGIGGMKSVHFRSLGAAHTAIVKDRQHLSTTQNGSFDLSLLPTDFIDKLEMIHLAPTSVELPVGAKLAATIVHIETKHNWNRADSTSGVLGISGGSFAQFSAACLGIHQNEKWRITVSGKFRQFSGDYPFSYYNGSQLVETNRHNSQVKDVYGTFSITRQFKNRSQLFFQCNGLGYDKGLPGAVVFYNETTGQYLSGQDFSASLQYHFTTERLEMNSSVTYQTGYLKYVDSTYLNQQGFLLNTYHSQQTDAQSQVAYQLNKRMRIAYGIAAKLENLQSERYTTSPSRRQLDQLIGMRILGGKFETHQLNAQLGYTIVHDLQPQGIKQTYTILPALNYSHKINEKSHFSIGYKLTQRQPSFSELYYQQIGNNALKPETAHLCYLNTQIQSTYKKYTFSTLIQPFFTHTLNKIVAIPTQNLFIWSIINVGKSNAFGIEFNERIAHHFEKSKLSLFVNYTYQYAVDVSDPNSTTYQHILAYSPMHSGACELTYRQKKWSVFTLVNFQGARYALNENIPQNLLEAFVTIDMGSSYEWNIKNKRLTARLALNNLTNNYYSYVRYFIMPGIHFNLQLSYAL